MNNRTWWRRTPLRLGFASLGLLVILTLTVPPLRSFAQDVISYLTRADGDSLDVGLDFTDPDGLQMEFDTDNADPANVGVDVRVIQAWDEDGNPIDPDTLSGHVPNAVTDLTIEQVGEVAEYDILTPTTLPDGYEYVGGQNGQVTPFAGLTYSDGDGNLRIFQIPSDMATENTYSGISVDSINGEVSIDYESIFGLIGASAQVDPVTVGGAEGEYVRGAWEVDAEGMTLEEMQENNVSVRPTWNPNANTQSLLWEQDGMRFQIVAEGGDLTVDDLIAVAESMELTE